MKFYLIAILSYAWIEVELLVEVPHLVEAALLGATFRLVEAHLVAYLIVLDNDVIKFTIDIN